MLYDQIATLQLWLNCNGQYWIDNEPLKHRPTPFPNGARYEYPYAMLSSLLGHTLVHTKYGLDEHFDKVVNIPDVGPVRFTLHDRFNSRGLMRLYMDCPICHKHISVGRFVQHSRIHYTIKCLVCGNHVTASKYKAHIRMHIRDKVHANSTI